MLKLKGLTSADERVRLVDKVDRALTLWTYASHLEPAGRQQISRPCSDWQALRTWEDDGGRCRTMLLLNENILATPRG